MSGDMLSQPSQQPLCGTPDQRDVHFLSYPGTDHHVCRFQFLDQMRDLIAVRIADRKGSGKRAGVPRPVYDFLAHMERIRAEDAQLKVTDLTLGGNELMEMGIPAGRGMGDVLKRLLEEVKSGALVNEKEALSARVREYGGVH